MTQPDVLVQVRTVQSLEIAMLAPVFRNLVLDHVELIFRVKQPHMRFVLRH